MTKNSFAQLSEAGSAEAGSFCQGTRGEGRGLNAAGAFGRDGETPAVLLVVL